MKFVVSRTSDSVSENPPCDGATLENVTYIERRNVDSPEKLKSASTIQEWYRNGSNHRVEHGQIARDKVRKEWVIEIEDLLSLMEFCEKYGNLVIESSNYIGLGELEIYDDLRE